MSSSTALNRKNPQNGFVQKSWQLTTLRISDVTSRSCGHKGRMQLLGRWSSSEQRSWPNSRVHNGEGRHNSSAGFLAVSHEAPTLQVLSPLISQTPRHDESSWRVVRTLETEYIQPRSRRTHKRK